MTGAPPDPHPPATHSEPPVRRGGIGPFSWRQLLTVVAVIGVAALALTLVTRPIGAVPAGATALPESTAYVVGAAKEGLAIGDMAPELSWTADDGTTQQLRDLQGNPVRLADLRGKLVWLNFWATWCPPCQGETPVLRDVAVNNGAGLAVIGIAVQETTPADVQAYADRYGLPYTIAFDATADIFKKYRVYALPTQILVDREGRVLRVVNGPMTYEG
ncbi:MAG: TlpA family protein disulfide reductase, partial [Chloroflexi bacterium]|nr:TlpA family protein disulfide reductase [Chloroflexota bacterium]